MGKEVRPRVLVIVLDATNLRLHLPFALEVKELGLPFCIALNMSDLAHSAGLKIDQAALEKEFGCPVLPISATRQEGLSELVRALQEIATKSGEPPAVKWQPPTRSEILARRKAVEDILRRAILAPGNPSERTARLDRIFLHPVLGPAVLLVTLFLIFQAIFTLGAIPTDWIDGLVVQFAQWTRAHLPAGLFADLLVDGVISGVGAVIVFLPQILILFACLLLLEDSGYMARAAFLMDRVMGRVGLSGRSVLPMVSGFACAIPAILGARSIQNFPQRLATILVTPLMTCSARLPVYTMLIAAFIPNKPVLGVFGLQGVVMTVLYVAGAASAFAFAALLKSLKLVGTGGYFLLELPTYRVPSWTKLIRGLVDRARAFLTRAGTFILSIMVLLWAISTFPRPPEGADRPAIEYSLAGKLGTAVAPVLAPLGFDWKLSVALIPGFAAREVLVSALGTVYAVEDTENQSSLLTDKLKADWSLPTALSLMAWYVFAPQCLATFAVMQREIRSWRWTLFGFSVLLAAAWLAAFLTFRLAGLFS
jgi:ferrous iron transport protein B